MTTLNKTLLIIASFILILNSFNFNNEKQKTNSPNKIYKVNNVDDDFEGGTLTGWSNTDDWINSTTSPINGSRSLQHNLVENGSNRESYIYQDISFVNFSTNTVTWRFNLKSGGGWDPSGSTKFWFYLSANETNLNGNTVDGYAVGVNLTGTNDILTIWKVTDGAADGAIITSTFNWNSNDQVGIEVIRTSAGEWTLNYDDDGNFDNLVSAGSATNNDYTSNNYCGLVYHMYHNRVNELWLDDVSIPDNCPPLLNSATATTTNKLKLQFSEDVEETSSEVAANYSVNNSIGQPTSAVRDASNHSVVELTFASNFSEGTNYTLTASDITDLSANTLTSDNDNFQYFPFELEDIYVISNNELICEFSQNLDQTTAETITNYTVNNSISNPTTATLETNTKQVKLTFGTNFTSNLQNNLNIQNVESEGGVIISNTDDNFTYHQVVGYDVVINEIMADPTPAVALPQYEYLEIYNNTAYEICMYNWVIKVGTTDKTITTLTKIASNEYVLICSSSAETALSGYANTISILGSIDLTNSGKEVSILTDAALEVDKVNYTDDWYQDNEKDDGGWSIERIDPNNTCGVLSNWRASVNVTGGTPGQQNSIYASNVDTDAPTIETISVSSINSLTLYFNEELNETDVSVLTNYLIDNSINPISASISSDDKSIVNLSFAADFFIGLHTLKVINIRDLCDNAINTINTTFTYYPGNEFDVLINEIMLDISPAPEVLPAAKYIELYNNTDLDIDLLGWQLVINDNSAKTIGVATIKAKNYIVLCSDDELQNFESYGNATDVLTESHLTMSEGQITILNSAGTLIDYVKYSDTWYDDENKDDGAWSLERIDATNYCEEANNWKASEDYKGGTPSATNSISASNANSTAFDITNISVLSSNKIAVSFSKNIKETQALEVSNYSVSDGLGNPILIDFSDTSRATVILQFANQFTDAKQHTLTVSNLKDFCDNALTINSLGFTYYLIYPKAVYAETENLLHIIFSEEVEIVTAQQTENYLLSDSYGNPSKAIKHSERKNEVYLEYQIDFTNAETYTLSIDGVKDLNGNFMQKADLEFSFYIPSSTDIVINEILFNPRTDGVDFVEIYNKSTFSIDLKQIKIATRDETGELKSIYELSETNNLLKPTEILAITKDSTITKTYYPATSYERFLQVSSMPSYNDDEGDVVILFNDTILDEFSYTDDMHFALISDDEGVSLERVSPLMPTVDISNWQSAAESVGFASPANTNSQYRQFSDNEEDEIKIEPEVFTPNNDGYDDQVFIRYKFKESGYVANLAVYNAKGKLLKRIATNELLATEGSFSWDGLHTDGRKAKIGIYIIYLEVFNLQGVVKKYKKTCVVATKL